MKKLIAFFGTASVIVISCTEKNKIPKDILSQEKMQVVLWGMISAGEYLDGYVVKKDSLNRIAETSKIYSQVFQVNGITKESFDKSYSYYREHPDLMKVLLDSLGKRQQIAPMGQPQQRPDTAPIRIIPKGSVQ
jgi:hypothetical protein